MHLLYKFPYEEKINIVDRDSLFMYILNNLKS